MRRRLRAAAAAAAIAALPAAALAKDLKVPSSTYPTITAAAAAAADGDRILVASGVYAEHVVLTANRVELKGVGAIWDGHIGPVSGNCLTIEGTDCTVSGFVFRNGNLHVVANGDRTSILRCTSRGASGDAFQFNSSLDARVDHCRIVSGAERGIGAGDSHRIVVSKNVIRATDRSAVELEECDDVRVEKNTVSGVQDDDAVVVDGPRADVVSNRVFTTGRRGIVVDGDDALVERNHVSNTSDDGITVSGDRAAIRNNAVSHGTDDSTGINYSGGLAAATTIERNVVADMTENGIRVSANGVTVRSNNVARCGVESDASIEISGSGNTVESNRVDEADVDGILITGDNNTVRNCIVTVSYEDGVVVFGDANTFSGLKVTGCDGEGFENQGTNTRLTDSTLLGNRLDLARGLAATWVLPLTNVKFKTGGADVIAEVDK
jgi:parallel beta-helix repeat protein